MDFTNDDKKVALALARKTIEAELKKTQMPDVSGLSPVFEETASCFVTLHSKDGNLRGCIGNIGAFEPLAKNIIGNAINAAFRDTRFLPVGSDAELDGLEIEISVLTPPVEIPSIDEFIIGKHGIILSNDGRSAVFLPQVAPEQGWDKETTLTQLSLKAGLPPYTWQSRDTCFSVFEAIVFSEKDFPTETQVS